MGPMKTYLVGYLATLVTLAILDAAWLGVVSREFYKARLGQLLLEQPQWYAAILFYLINALAIVVFVVPLATAGVWAARFGALFGFCVHAAYALPTLATLGAWPLHRCLPPPAWG